MNAIEFLKEKRNHQSRKITWKALIKQKIKLSSTSTWYLWIEYFRLGKLKYPHCEYRETAELPGIYVKKKPSKKI